MPNAMLEPAASSTLQSVPRKRWTRAEIGELTSMGWFAGKHYELIDGELIEKMGKLPPHVMGVLHLHEWLISIFGFWNVRKEDPIEVAAEDREHNDPEPDLVALRVSGKEFTARNPGPEDILLAIEVADSTLPIDRSEKAALYARAGIPDYWILDVRNRRMIVHREPINGKYGSVVVYEENESVTPLAAPQSEFRVAAAFGA